MTKHALRATEGRPKGWPLEAFKDLYLKTAAEPYTWPSQGFKEYRYDPPTWLTSDLRLYHLPACTFPPIPTPSLVPALYLPPCICRVPDTSRSIAPSIREPSSRTCIPAGLLRVPVAIGGGSSRSSRFLYPDP